ncbi:MAG: hypothetical protein WCT05_06235 [Lentisphaeria bacterium]
MKKFLCLVLVQLLCCKLIGTTAEPLAPSTPTLIQQGKMVAPPTIDGSIERSEWLSGSSFFGGRSNINGLMTNRYCVYYFGYDTDNLFFAFRSETPLPPIVLGSDDTVEIMLLPPGTEKAMSFTLNSFGKNNFPSGTKYATGFINRIRPYGYPCWEAEIAIPLVSIGAKVEEGREWGLQMVRNWCNPQEAGYWHFPANPGEMGTFIPDAFAPAVGVPDFGEYIHWRASANYTFNFTAFNPSEKPIKINSEGTAFIASGTSKLNSDFESDTEISKKNITAFMAPVAGQAAYGTHVAYNLWPGKINLLKFRFVDANKKMLYQRDIAWDLSKGNNWKDELGVPNLLAAFYPSYENLLLLNFSKGRQTDIISAIITISNENHSVIKTVTVPKNGEFCNNWESRINLPGLAEGAYKVTLESTTKSGNKFTCPRTFAVQEFPWQKAPVGLERVIIPPFMPLQVKNENEVHAIQTGYRADGILWNKIFAQGENILAEPVELLINGEKFVCKKPEIVLQEKDRIVIESGGIYENLKVKVIQDYDYDGFCFVTLKFNAADMVRIQSLTLQIPLQSKYVTLFNANLFTNETRAKGAHRLDVPDKQGIVWTSNDAGKIYGGSWSFDVSFQQYFWFGGIYKGFCWFIESGHQHFSHEESVPAQRLVRNGDKITFTVDFINKLTTWPKGKNATMEMGFQPTPVKPVAKAFYRTAEHMYQYLAPENAVWAKCIASPVIIDPKTATIPTFPNDDKALQEYIITTTGKTKPAETRVHEGKLGQQKLVKDYRAVLDAFVKRNQDYFDRNGLSSAEYHQHQGIWWRQTYMKYLGSYMNPALLTCFWPEWEMYKSEWQQFNYPEENYMNEYMCSLVKSRRDKLVYDARELVRLGFMGINFDCFPCGAGGGNTITSNAYHDNNGRLRHNCGGGIMRWRLAVKRTAHMLYSEKKLVYGRPWVDVHTTMYMPVPLVSFASTITTWERGSNGGDYQVRFPESNILADTIGTQAGVYPFPIVSTRMGDETRKERELKTLMSTMCSFGLMHLMDQGLIYRDWFDKAWNYIFDFGYGRDDVELFFTWEKQPVTTDAKDIRMTVAKRKDGKTLLMIGNLGDAVRTKINLSDLGYNEYTLSNAENGAAVAENTISVDEHGYTLVLIEKL